MTEPAVDDPDELTPAWVTDALRAGGHDLAVTSVTTERIGTGQMGRTYRLALGYEGEPGPPTLVAKLAGEDEAMRTMVAAGYAAEVGFYRELAAALDVRTPRCWYGSMAEDHVRFTLLLDDLAPAEPGVQADGCTPAQARASVRNLVGLHAPRWNDPGLADLAFLIPFAADAAELLRDALVTATDGFLERYERQLEEHADTLRDASRAIADWLLARPEPFALVHGDYRLDNLLFAPTGDDVVAVDWQSVTSGPPLRDVAYFLGTSLTTEDRRAHEEALVGGYHEALVAAGVTGYGAEQCWDDYRLGHLQGPMITILGCMYASGERTERSDAMFLAMASRSAAAIRDLGSLDLL